MILYVPVGDRAIQADHANKKKCSTMAKLLAIGLLLAACYAWFQGDLLADQPAAQAVFEEVQEMFFKEADGSGGIDTTEADKHIRDEKTGMLKLDLDWGKASAPFYMRHESSNYYLHPRKGGSNPSDNTYISLYRGNPSWARWIYVPFRDYQGYGVIRHVDSGKYLHPRGGSANPSSGVDVVVHNGYHFACVFTFFQTSRTVHHYAGLNFHVKNEKPNAGEQTPIVLRAGTNAASSFQARDGNGRVVDLHKPTIPKGHWEIVLQRYNPRSQYTETIKTTIGFSSTKTVTSDVSLTTEISAKFAGIGASTKYSVAFGTANSQTWNKEDSKSQTWTVYPGPSVCVYQWSFDGTYDTMNLAFRSNIFADTDCTVQPPNLMKV